MTDLVLITLGAWRFAYLITQEDGPGNVMGRLRAWVHSEPFAPKLPLYPDGGTAWKLDAGLKPGSLAKGITCFKCMSVWGAALAWLLLRTPLRGIVQIAAGSAAAILISEYVGIGYSKET